MAFVTRTKLQERLRKWDHGNRASRLHQLEEFIEKHSNNTKSQLDAEMENGASLFLARITSWLRLSYALGHSVALLLRAISVFITAFSGQRFLAEFVEVGGVATVIEILKIPQLPEEDQAQALYLLGSILDAGRHYKEIVCDQAGVDVLEAFMKRSTSEERLEQATELLLLLGRGNPSFSATVHRSFMRLMQSDSSTTQLLACTGLRQLLSSLPPSQLVTAAGDGSQLDAINGRYCEAAISLLSSFNLQILYEANELLSVFMKIGTLEETVLTQLMRVVAEAAVSKQVVSKQVPMHKLASVVHALGKLFPALPYEKREAYAAKLEVVPWLCSMLTHAERHSAESEKEMVRTLQLLAGCEGGHLKEMKSFLGETALEHVLNASDASQAIKTLSPDAMSIINENTERFLERQSGKPVASTRAIAEDLQEASSFNESEVDHDVSGASTQQVEVA